MGMEDATKKGQVQEFFYKKLLRRPSQPMAEWVTVCGKAVLDMKGMWNSCVARGWPGGGPGVARGWPGGGPGVAPHGRRRQAKSATPWQQSPLACEGCSARGRECPVLLSTQEVWHTQNMTKCSNYCALIVCLVRGRRADLAPNSGILVCRDLSKKAIRSAMSACRHRAGKCCTYWCDVGSPRSRQPPILPTAVAARSHVLWWLNVSTLAIGAPIACANYTSIRRLLLHCLLLLLFDGGRCSRLLRELRSLGSLLRSPM